MNAENLGAIIPVAVGLDTVWLALLSYWASWRIGQLTDRLDKSESTVKILKKRLEKETKIKNGKLRNIEATLREHDRRLLELSGGKQHESSDDRYPDTKQRRPEKVPSYATESESSSSDSSCDDVDLSGVYNAQRKRK